MVLTQSAKVLSRCNLLSIEIITEKITTKPPIVKILLIAETMLEDGKYKDLHKKRKRIIRNTISNFYLYNFRKK